jgi:transcriptional regulator GlxA family with amidase domain
MAATGNMGVGMSRLPAPVWMVASVPHLVDEDVSAPALAKRQRVTSRFIHKLFEGEETTLSQFVLRQRLARAHRMLTDPLHGHQTISVIACDAGFGDLSTFNRAFRRHFGATPSEVRAAARS